MNLILDLIKNNECCCRRNEQRCLIKKILRECEDLNQSLVVGATFNLEGIGFIDSLFNGRFDSSVTSVQENTLIDYGEKVVVNVESITDPSINYQQTTNSSSAFLFEQLDDGCYKLSVVHPPDDLQWELVPVLSHYTVCGGGSSSRGIPSSVATDSLSDTIESSSIVIVRQDIAFLINTQSGCIGTIANTQTCQLMTLQSGTYYLRYYGWCVVDNTTTTSNSSCSSLTSMVFPDDCKVVVQSSYQVTVQYRGQIKLTFTRDMVFSLPNSKEDTPKANINVTLSYFYNNLISHSIITCTTMDTPIFSVPLVPVSVLITTNNISQIILLNNITATPTLAQPNINITFSIYELPPLKDKSYIPVTLYSQSSRCGLSITLPPGVYSREFLSTVGFSNLTVLSFSSPSKYRVFLSLSIPISASVSDIPLNGYFAESYNTGIILQVQIVSNYEFSNNPLPLFGGNVEILNIYHSLFKPSYYLVETPHSKIDSYILINCTDAPLMGYHNCSFPSRVGPRYIKTQLNNNGKYLSYSELVYYPEYYSLRSIGSKLILMSTNLSNILDLSFNSTRININFGRVEFQVGEKILATYTLDNPAAKNYVAIDLSQMVFYNGTKKVGISNTKTFGVTTDSLVLTREGVSLMAGTQATWGIYGFPAQYWRFKNIHPVAFVMSGQYLDGLEPDRNLFGNRSPINNGLFFAVTNGTKVVVTKTPIPFQFLLSVYLQINQDGSLCFASPTDSIGTLVDPSNVCLAMGGLGGRYLLVAPQTMSWSVWALQILDERGRLVWALNSTEKIDYHNIPMDYGSYLHYTDSIVSTSSRNYITNGKQYLQLRPDGNLVIYENNVYFKNDVLAFTETEVAEDPPYILRVQDNGISLSSSLYPEYPYYQVEAIPGSPAIHSLSMYPQAGDSKSEGFSYQTNRIPWGVLMIDITGKVSGGLLGGQDTRFEYFNSVTIKLVDTPDAAEPRSQLLPQQNLTNQFLNLVWNDTTGIISVVQIDNNQVMWSSPEPPTNIKSVTGIYYSGMICYDSLTDLLQFCVAVCSQAGDPILQPDQCLEYQSVWMPYQGSERQQWFGLIIGFPELVLVSSGTMIWSAKISNLLLRNY
ncbi:hypothetical protein DFA_09584 [Cavenderia fasciculata]|uniref:Uncharacterized protein n=1 Tax=Cavenderia fasciculata TaxID=261658 RepID=F4Q813_CACFS|nr:uncharacterized protein DFA_09584 [Cavenderia fasciculata]EGG15913.1 hypothetical protein DFA_09584 [Cavenderia fasciculata]|eukprot:XP_004352238.1 hypothetical protein DFA_09584 [Cavenderia fasciculata]